MTADTYTSSTDREILRSIGERLRALRKARDLSQAEAAERADLARSTVVEVERGDNTTLQTVIRLLRVYGRLGALESFIPAPEVSPMARLRQRKEKEGG
jgi:transcriptional regulator with XRE-family HTH domain